MSYRLRKHGQENLLWTIGGLSMAFSGFIGLVPRGETSQNVMAIIAPSQVDSTVGGK
jgi:hypothetical protein